MKTLSISPTLLEEWRIVSNGLWNVGVERLEEKILRQFVPNEAISRGKAYHRILEEGASEFKKGSSYVVPEPEMGKTWVFTQDAIQPAIRLTSLYHKGAHEVWGRWETDLCGYRIVSRQRYDMLLGLQVHEFKTTAHSKKYTDYLDSLQWKMYLLGLPDAHSIVYHIFQIGRNNNWCRYNTYQFDRYDEMEADIKSQLSGFIHWLEGRPNLLDAISLRPKTQHAQ